VTRECALYRIALGVAQACRWDKGGILIVDVYNFFSGKENENCPLGERFLYTPENSIRGYNNSLLLIECLT
jgi:hypothetical protein